MKKSLRIQAIPELLKFAYPYHCFYRYLARLKKENESFSDVIWKLTKKRKPNLRDYFGGLKDSKAIIEIEEDCKKIRESARIRTI